MVDMVNHPPHYNSHPSGVECIEITEWLPFTLGNAVKYVWRMQEKENDSDGIHKAQWYLARYRKQAQTTRWGPEVLIHQATGNQLDEIKAKLTTVIESERRAKQRSFFMLLREYLNAPKVQMIEEMMLTLGEI